MVVPYSSQEGTIDFVAASQKHLRLKNTQDTDMLGYKMRLTLTTTNGANPALTARQALACITELKVTAAGNNNIKQIPGLKFLLNAIRENGREDLSTFDLTASAAGKTQQITFYVPFASNDTIKPHDTLLPIWAFKNLDMYVTWGSASIGTDVTITAGSLEIYADAVIGYQRIDNAGNPTKVALLKENSQIVECLETTPKKQVLMPIELMYKSIGFICTTNGALTDGVLNAVRIKAGASQLIELPVWAIRSENYCNSKVDKSEDLTGLYWIDFSKRKYLTDMLDTASAAGYRNLTIELDVVGAAGNQIEVFSDTVQFL